MAKEISVTRKQLFDSLWNIGYQRSAELYGVSLNDLLKACQKHNIPMPDSEYFAKKHKAEAVDIPKLPDAEDNNERIRLQTVYKRRKRMESAFGSKANAVCVLQTLEDYSDFNKPLSVSDIIGYLDTNYRVRVDRRTVYNTVELLKDLGYDIDIQKIGSKYYYYLDSKILEPIEVKILMDSLALNPLLPVKARDEISNKINQYLAKRGPLQCTWWWHSMDKQIEKYDTDPQLYCYLDEIDAAQSQGKKLEFEYITYDTNGNPVPYQTKPYSVTPYHLKLEHGMYYLCCSGENDNEFVEVRLDRMRNVRMSEEAGNKKGIAGKGRPLGVCESPKSCLPCLVTLQCDNDLIDKVTTDFAHQLKHLTVTDNGDGKTFRLTLFTNADFITRWAMSVADKCQVTEPKEIRNAVIEKLKNNQYGV